MFISGKLISISMYYSTASFWIGLLNKEKMKNISEQIRPISNELPLIFLF